MCYSTTEEGRKALIKAMINRSVHREGEIHRKIYKSQNEKYVEIYKDKKINLEKIYINIAVL
jgi:hypothetical protein